MNVGGRGVNFDNKVDLKGMYDKNPFFFPTLPLELI